MKQLQDSVAAEDQNVDVSWEVGRDCAVHFSKENCWYRAIVTEMDADSYKVLASLSC